jgi:signal transduction histidine kinase/DNA-binding response OmpR family regulator
MVAAVVGVMLIVFAAGGAFRLRVSYTLESLQNLAADADRVTGLADALLIGLLDAESNARAYVLTRREAYLDSYRAARSTAEGELGPLREAAHRFGSLVDDMDHVQTSVAARLALLDQGVQAGAAGADLALDPLIGSRAGREAMTETRAQIETLIQHAAAERNRQSAEAQAGARLLRIAVTLGAILGVLLLGGAAVALLVGRDRLLRAQDALLAQASLWQATVENLHDGVAVFDAQGCLVQWNRTLAPLTGFTADLLRQGMPFSQFEAASAEWNPPVLAGGPNLTAAETRTGGRVLEVSRHAMPDGGYMLTFGDITRRVEAEAIARQAHKMEVLGQLTGGVAHDFNNLLQIISANLDLVSSRLRTDQVPPPDWLRSRLLAAMEGVDRGARLTRHLLAFARRQPLAPEPIDVAELLGGLEDMLRRTLGSAIAVERVISGGLWTLRADAQQLESAILNLAINARDAMADNPPDRARLTIEACNASLDDAYCAANPEGRPGQYVMIAVSDSGCGMTADEVSRAIEPFYTTKPEGQGTGLGLSMVYGFAKQSGGHLKLYSEPGHGTTARLYIPRTTAPVAPLDMQRAPPTPGQGEIILLVEDDSAVRTAAALALCGLGYRVEQAENADAALAMLERGLRPELIFSDVVMPGTLSARALAARATAMIPGLAVVFASGYTENFIVHNGQLDPDVHLISKPWRIEDLASRLRLALDLARQTQRAAVPPRILLVEDDKLIRMLTAEMLMDLGYEVVEAGDAETALDLLAGVDLMITDVGLGKMDGLALVDAVHDRVPLLPVIVASGRAPPDAQDGLLWLKKPYDSTALRAALAQVHRRDEGPPAPPAVLRPVVKV